MQKVVFWFLSLRRYIRRHQVGIYAANTSFFLLLSCFPALMLLLALLKYTPISQSDFLSAAYASVPVLFHPILKYFVGALFSEAGGTVISLSAVSAAWAASRGVYSLLEGLNKIYHLPERRGYFLRRIVCLFDTLLLMVALIVTLVGYVFGKRIAQALSGSRVPIVRLILLLLRMRWLVVAVVLCFLFLIVFTVFPNRRQKIRSALPGAIGAAIGWVVFSAGYVFYAERFGNYASVYGSLATVALAMVWLYACMSILFYGALLNRVLEVRRRKKPFQ